MPVDPERLRGDIGVGHAERVERKCCGANHNGLGKGIGDLTLPKCAKSRGITGAIVKTAGFVNVSSQAGFDGRPATQPKDGRIL